MHKGFKRIAAAACAVMMAASIMHVTYAKKAEVVFGCILHQVEIVFTQIQIVRR